MSCSISDLNTSYPKMLSFFIFPDSIRTNTEVVASPLPCLTFLLSFLPGLQLTAGTGRWIGFIRIQSEFLQHSNRNIVWNQNSKHMYIMRFRFVTSALMQFLRANSNSNPRLVTMTWFLNSSIFSITHESMPDTAEVLFWMVKHSLYQSGSLQRAKLTALSLISLWIALFPC